MLLDFQPFNLHLCPSSNDIDHTLEAILGWSKIITRIRMTFFSAGIIYLSFVFFNPINAISFSFVGIVGSYLLLLGLSSRIWGLLPSYKKYISLSEARR